MGLSAEREIVFSLRLQLLAALPGVAVGFFAVIINMDERDYKLIWWVFLPGLFGFGSAYTILSFLRLLAWLKIMRADGRSLIEIVASILATMAGWAIFALVYESTKWAAKGITFEQMSEIAFSGFIVYVVVRVASNYIAEQRRKNSLNVLDERPSKSRSIIKR